MPSISVTPLSNGFTPVSGESLVKLFPGPAGAILYLDSLGVLHVQSAVGVPMTTLQALPFVPTASASYYDGAAVTLVFGGSAGQLAVVSVDGALTPTMSTATVPGEHFTGFDYDYIRMGFLSVSSGGSLGVVDFSAGFSLLDTLTAAGPLLLVAVSYVPATDSILVLGNTVPAGSSVVFYGKAGSLVSHEIAGKTLQYAAVGRVQEASTMRNRMVVAGGLGAFYYSDDGADWQAAPIVDQEIQMFGLAFLGWVFIAPAQFGVVLLSTDGKVWESAYAPDLSSDLVSVSAVS